MQTTSKLEAGQNKICVFEKDAGACEPFFCADNPTFELTAIGGIFPCVSIRVVLQITVGSKKHGPWAQTAVGTDEWRGFAWWFRGQQSCDWLQWLHQHDYWFQPKTSKHDLFACDLLYPRLSLSGRISGISFRRRKATAFKSFSWHWKIIVTNPDSENMLNSVLMFLLFCDSVYTVMLTPQILSRLKRDDISLSFNNFVL